MRMFSRARAKTSTKPDAHLPDLSILCSVPNEILHRVFFFAVGSCNRHQLLDICSVSRRWYRSAVEHCPLWTTLPPIHLDNAADLQSIRRIVNSITVCLARSGILPISFNLTVEDGPFSDSSSYRDTVSMVVGLLISQCHRWGQASLNLSTISMPALMPIQARLPMLTSLKLSSPLRHHFGYKDNPAALFDLFKDAPRLRHVVIDTPRNHWGTPSTSPAFAFQWARLESFEFTQGVDKGVYYSTLMDSQPISLRSLELRTRVLRQLPRTPLSLLPRLEKLAFRVQSGIECDILTHLGTLVLPALTHLELWGRLRDSPDEAYNAVEGLVRRSGCSLRSLYLCLSSINGSVNSFSNLLSLSPEIETLHITVPRADVIRALVLDPAAPVPLLPNLQTLGFHTWYSTTMAVLPLDLKVLANVIQSRTVVSVDQEDGASRALHETIFVYTSDTGVRSAIFCRGLLSRLDGRFDPALEETAQNIMSAFGKGFTDGGPSMSWNRRQSYHPTMLAKMEGVMRDIEGLKVEDGSTQALVRYGLPRFLHHIGREPDSILSGDLVLRFPSRARKLVEKWKPHILRDARAGEYRWSCPGRGIVSLKSNQGSEGYATTNEELWNAILGVGDETSAYDSLKKWASFPDSFS